MQIDISKFDQTHLLVIGDLMSVLIMACEAGQDHDKDR